jgi:hypothetical protein
MIAGIIGVPTRIEMIKELRDIISPSVDSVDIFMDHQWKGHWWNLSRAICALTAKAKQGEPVLLMTDDAITVPDWRERWEIIHAKAGNTIYSLFSRQRFLFNDQNLLRGYITKCQHRGFYDLAFILIDKPNFIQDVQHWFDNGGKDTPPVIRRQSHLDVVMQEYLIAHNIQWTISTPTIFDHRDSKSTMGHTIGFSPFYVGRKIIGEII